MQARRFCVVIALGVANVATDIIGLTMSQPARDFNAVSDHGISGWGTPQITAGRRHALIAGGDPQVFKNGTVFAAAVATATIRARAVPAERPAASGQMLRV